MIRASAALGIAALVVAIKYGGEALSPIAGTTAEAASDLKRILLKHLGPGGCQKLDFCERTFQRPSFASECGRYCRRYSP